MDGESPGDNVALYAYANTHEYKRSVDLEDVSSRSEDATAFRENEASDSPGNKAEAVPAGPGKPPLITRVGSAPPS